ncbi:MAG TPA: hypothetical protein VF168_02065 [Trueperaceae bacterium]
MSYRFRRLQLLLLPLLISLLAGCSQLGALEVWTGVSQQLDYVSLVEVEFRRSGYDIVGIYTLNGDLNGEGVIDGVIREGIIVATLSASTNCRFDFVGTATETTIKGDFEPNTCLGGYSGTWSLQRKR